MNREEELEKPCRHEPSSEGDGEVRQKEKYKESVLGMKGRNWAKGLDFLSEGEVSEDNAIEEGDDKTCFGIGMTCEEKIKAHRPWQNFVIIKLVGRIIGYNYLWRRIQAMW